MDLNKIDKTAFSIADLRDNGGEKNFWLTKTPQERIQAMEIMREILYGYDSSTARLQRVFEIAKLK